MILKLEELKSEYGDEIPVLVFDPFSSLPCEPDVEADDYLGKFKVIEITCGKEIDVQKMVGH